MSAEQASQRSLWMGDLAAWMDEAFLFGLFQALGQPVTAKVIRNRTTQRSEGYGFIEFATVEAAEAFLRTFNGCAVPNTDQVFRLGRATFGRRGLTEGTALDHSVFVGDLAPEVTDYALQENFRQFFTSVRSAKVITDPMTGRSKGYGFVRFGSEPERDQALTDMMGHMIMNRPVRVSHATAKKTPTGVLSANAPHPSDFDPANTTLFIGGLSASITEDDLRILFGRFGDIIYVKIPPGKGCGFVQYVHRPVAELAMQTMQSQVLGGSAVRVSWGRSASAGRTAAATAVAMSQLQNYAAGLATPPYQPGSLLGTGAVQDPYAAAYAPLPSQGYSQTLASGATRGGRLHSLSSANAGAMGRAQMLDFAGSSNASPFYAAYLQRQQGLHGLGPLRH